MTTAPSPLPVAGPFETWIFDLDNTLYPANCDLFAEVLERITRYVAERLGLDMAAAHHERHKLFTTYGTTLRGLMIEHGVDPAGYLEFVHDIDFSTLAPDPELDAALARLPGRKLVFTNASLSYAEKVVERLGLGHHFEGIFAIEAADYVPKPEPAVYQKLVDRFTVRPRSAVMIEDIARNLVPAAALGMTTVWMPNGRDWDHGATDNTHIDHTIDDLTGWLTAQARAA